MEQCLHSKNVENRTTATATTVTATTATDTEVAVLMTKPRATSVLACYRRGATVREAARSLGVRISLLPKKSSCKKPALALNSKLSLSNLQEMHIVRMSLLLVSCGLMSVCGARKSLRSRFQSSGDMAKFITYCLTQHVENFVRHFDAGSRRMFSTALSCTCAWSRLVLIIILRAIVVSGSRIREFLNDLTSIGALGADRILEAAGTFLTQHRCPSIGAQA